ncbi:MAG: class I SAM-dependent methyltransferase [Terriglobia bacterium]
MSVQAESSSPSASSGGDRTGREFWDRWWEKSPLPASLDPYRRGLKNYPVRKLHEYFESVFEGHETEGKKLIEIGCAQSVILPYLAKQFGFEVWGIDQSKLGCERSRMVLEREQVRGEVCCCDFFAIPESLRGQFDVVFSMGVVEHFENTADAVRAMSMLLKPGGRMITTIPNFTGFLRSYQKLLDRAIYEVQVPLDREGLNRAHQDAGFEVESCEYFLPISLEVLNVASWPRRLPYWITVRTHGVISRAVWLVDDHFAIFKPNRWTSPFVHCVARKPKSSGGRGGGDP